MAELAPPLELAAVIEREHAEWQDPLVDRELFGTDDARAIAARLEAFCANELGSRVRSARFHRVSIGAVTGLDLEDGSSVVLKVTRGARPERFLAACIALRRELCRAGFPCPEPIRGPLRLGHSWITVDALDERGELGDAHEPALRRELAAGLAWLFELTRRFADDGAFGGAWFSALPAGQVYPRPHSPLFDFEATRDGAEWIDALAARARARAPEATGEISIGHFDWRAEHARFEGGKLATTYDWDSLHREREPVMVGAAAHAFTADFQREGLRQAPGAHDVEAFIADYQLARGRPFDAGERRTCLASLVYSLSYTARCNHAQALPDGANSDFRPLLRDHGPRWLTE